MTLVGKNQKHCKSINVKVLDLYKYLMLFFKKNAKKAWTELLYLGNVKMIDTFSKNLLFHIYNYIYET